MPPRRAGRIPIPFSSVSLSRSPSPGKSGASTRLGTSGATTPATASDSKSIRRFTAGSSAATTASPSSAVEPNSHGVGSSNATAGDDASSSPAKRKRLVMDYIELSDGDGDKYDKEENSEDDDIVLPGSSKARRTHDQSTVTVTQPRFSGKSNINMEAERSLADMYCDNTDEELEAIAQQLESRGPVSESLSSRPVAGSSRQPAYIAPDEDESDVPLAAGTSTSMGGFIHKEQSAKTAARPIKKARRRRVQIDSDLSEYETLYSSDLSTSESEPDEEENPSRGPSRSTAHASAAATARSAVPGSSTAGPSAASSGAYDDQRRFETAKQRDRRLKSEHRTSRLKKRPRMSLYEKTNQTLLHHHKGLRTVWDRIAEWPEPTTQKATQPDGLTIKLLPFQLEGLHWLMNQEKGPWSGGCLADEMGMGKTIQMISLFLSDRKKPNLVVLPTVAIMQWRNEIAKYTTDFKVLVWHGTSREVDAKALCEHDVVLTSYNVMESSFRKEHTGFKRKGVTYKEPSPIHAVEWHRIVLDEAHCIKERATNTAKAAFALKGKNRWALSGTPLQNRIADVFSIVKFLAGPC